ncbi:SHOCT domain-containing protein [Clostridium swellfunianum]|uniref:SHOCT domain-containing protein n=1 Tax=Clostridium swellfunianum TaxID=1367462 RepID=UPI00202E6E77|nr:SHOCT domain-containing protein [Clostridium swellfunianum]MCM0647279.1 SHOCT domain-containing protein [Clostridium swellfunianum]
MMAWGGLFWFLLLTIIVIISIAVYKITTSGRNNQNRTINDNSIEILKQRFARGEIDENQYKRMRDTIESK